MSLKGAVEAALLASGGPISTKELSLIVGSPMDDVESALKSLRSEYREREGGIEIAYQAGGAWVLQVTKQYVALVQRLVPMELETALLKTLSLIAFLQPVTQARVVDQRGAGAYVHVRQLAKRGLISREREGNSYLLTTTTEFSRRFRLKDDPEAIRQAMLERAKALEQTGIVEQATALVEQLVDTSVVPQIPGIAPSLGVSGSDGACPEETAACEPLLELPSPEAISVLEGRGPADSIMREEALSDSSSAIETAPPITGTPHPQAVSESPVNPESDLAASAEQPDNITRLSDHKSLRHQILEAREEDAWVSEKGQG